jgi:DnaA-homolog protein
MKQLALDMGLTSGPTLASFVAGPNSAVVSHLTLWIGNQSNAATRSPVPTYVWGGSASGKTHLLKAAREALREQGAVAGWLDATVLEPPAFNESWAAVLMDDVHLYTAIQQICHCVMTCARGWAGVMCLSCMCSASPNAVPCCANRPMHGVFFWVTR